MELISVDEFSSIDCPDPTFVISWNWISVEDRMPLDDDEIVLCWNPNKDFPLCGGFRLEAGASPGLSLDFAWRRNVSHWIPLPSPPKEDEHGVD